jgi:hypothetical protein
LRRIRSETSRVRRSARRRSLAPIGSFEVGVPESEPSIRSRRSNSAIPQLQPPPQLPLRIQLRPQRRILGILRLDHSPQPLSNRALLNGLARLIGLIGHKPRSCST